MKILLTADPKDYMGASNQTLIDISRIGSQFNFDIYSLGNLKRPLEYIKVFKTILKINSVLVAYPYFCRPIDNPLRYFELALIKIASKHSTMIVYVVDLPLEQKIANGLSVSKIDKNRRFEKYFFNSFNKILVFNDEMRYLIEKNYGIDKNKFENFEILDYTVNQPKFKEKKLESPYHIGYAGSFNKNQINEFINNISINGKVKLDVFGRNGVWINQMNNKNIKYHGYCENPLEVVNKLADLCHFGLIYFGDNNEGMKKYYEITSTSKLSAYLVSGVPIMVSNQYRYISKLVDKYNIGIKFQCMEEIPQIIENITSENYNTMKKKAYLLGNKISDGYFLKRCLSL